MSKATDVRYGRRGGRFTADAQPARSTPCDVCGFPVWAPGRTRHHQCDDAPLSEQTLPFAQPSLFDPDTSDEC